MNIGDSVKHDIVDSVIGCGNPSYRIGIYGILERLVRRSISIVPFSLANKSISVLVFRSTTVRYYENW